MADGEGCNGKHGSAVKTWMYVEAWLMGKSAGRPGRVLSNLEEAMEGDGCSPVWPSPEQPGSVLGWEGTGDGKILQVLRNLDV